MNLIHRNIRQGKTETLIRLCAEQGGYMVVLNQKEAHRVAERARELDLTIPFPLTFDELLKGQFNATNCSPLWIDNVDELLLHLARGATIGAASLTNLYVNT